jgi:hypothetical protein
MYIHYTLIFIKKNAFEKLTNTFFLIIPRDLQTEHNTYLILIIYQ